MGVPDYFLVLLFAGSFVFIFGIISPKLFRLNKNKTPPKRMKLGLIGLVILPQNHSN